MENKQMTKKQIVELLSLFTVISSSKNAESELQRSGITEDQIDKMMRIFVSIFKNDEKKAEDFIRKQFANLLKKLDAHDDSKCQIKSFKGDK